MGKPTKVAVIGVGRMGNHHARTYANVAEAELVAVVDRDEERAETVADAYGAEGLPSVDVLLDRHPDLGAVTVAVPTAHHVAAATPLLERGVACLIEKPLAGTSAECRQLAELAEDHDAVLQVGHTERFNPAVRALSAMKARARFVEVDRVSPMTFRSLDVGVVMDMMIHDLDIVLSLVGSPIAEVRAAGFSLISPYEDVADTRIVFDSGCVAKITTSRLALKTERKLRLFSESAYVTLDYQARTGLMLRLDKNARPLEWVREQLAAGADLSNLDYKSVVQVEELKMDLPEGEDDPLTGQCKSFLAAARGEHPPEVDAGAGVAAVAAAEQVLEAIRGHAWEGLEGKV